MAINVQNSHFSFARIFILAESTQLRSSPLHEAPERYSPFLKKSTKKIFVYQKLVYLSFK